MYLMQCNKVPCDPKMNLLCLWFVIMEDIVQVAAGGKIHPEAIPLNLDLHTDIPTQIAVQNAFYINVNPLNSIDGSNDITFMIRSSLNNVIQPSRIRQKLKLQIKKFKGNVASEGNKGGGQYCYKKYERYYKDKKIPYDQQDIDDKKAFETWLKSAKDSTKFDQSIKKLSEKIWPKQYKEPPEIDWIHQYDNFDAKKEQWHKDIPIKENQVIPVNNIVQSIWKNVLVKINNHIVSTGDSCYPYRADIETKFMSTKEGKKNLKLGGWYEEKKPWDVYESDEVPINWTKDFPTLFDVDEGIDPALQHRYGFTHNEQSKGVWEVSGPVHSEIFELKKVLPPNAELIVEFTKQNMNSFYILTTQEDSEWTYLIDILDMQLEVHYLTVDPSIVQEMMFETKRKAYVYPLRQVNLRWFNQPTSISDINSINVLSQKNKLPRRMFIGFVDSQAFSGHQNKDPFYYQNLHMKESSLTVGNQMRPYPILRYHLPEVTAAVMALQDATSGCFSDAYTGYDSWDLVNRSFVLCYKLSPSDSAPGECYEMLPAESVTFYANLEKPTDKVMIMIVYSEYDAEMLIDEKGSVIIN